MHIAEQLRYSDRCRALLHQTLAAAPPELLHATFYTTSRFDSIARIIAHCVAAEERWVRLRIRGLDLPVDYEERAATDPDGLFADAAAVRRETWETLDSLDEAGLSRRLHVHMPRSGLEMTLTLEQIFFQVVNHENYHRGQIVQLLQRAGLDPPNFDYILLRSD